MNGHQNTHLGTKILYTVVIVMSSLILLLSAIGIIGVWLVQGPLSDAAVTLLSVVETSTRAVRTAGSRADQALGVLQGKTTEIADASDQLSQNVADKGLVLVLLPEQKEQQLIETAGSMQDTYQGIRESIARGLDLYRSINRIPFVSLPGLGEDQLEKVDNAVTGIQELVQSLQSEIAEFRSGVAGNIDKVTGLAQQLDNEINKIRDELAQLDAKLADLEALSIRLQEIIPGIFLAIAFILTVLLAFLIFTQVEVIRLYLNRWRLLGQPQPIPAAELPAQTPPEGEAGLPGE